MTRLSPAVETCPQTPATLLSTRSGRRDEEFTTHLAGCAACRAAVVVDRALSQASSAPVRLPSPGILRLRARLRLRERAAARAGRWHFAMLSATLLASLAAVGRSLLELGSARAGASVGLGGGVPLALPILLVGALLGFALLALLWPYGRPPLFTR